MRTNAMYALRQIVEYAENELKADKMWIKRTRVVLFLKNKQQAAHVAGKAILCPNLVVEYNQVGNDHLLSINVGRLTKFNTRL